MGYVYTDLVVRGRKEKKIRGLVDTGGTYIVLGPESIRELELTPTGFEAELVLADKRKVKAKIYVGEAEAEGSRGPILVAELDFSVPHVGVYALETLGLKPNPVTGKLEVVGPEGGYLL